MSKHQLANRNESKTLVCILAAGASRRFGAPKQLAKLASGNLLQCSINTLAQVASQINGDLALVLGANEMQIKPHLKGHFILLSNLHWQSGMASSIVCAARYAEQHHYTHLLICLADQVALTATDYLTVLNASRCRRAAAYYQHRLAAPALFLAEDYAHLAGLTGDTGAKQLLRRHYRNGQLIACALPRASIDIDTQDQLISWQNKL